MLSAAEVRALSSVEVEGMVTADSLQLDYDAQRAIEEKVRRAAKLYREKLGLAGNTGGRSAGPTER